jgi:hypothetical protein
MPCESPYSLNSRVATIFLAPYTSCNAVQNAPVFKTKRGDLLEVGSRAYIHKSEGTPGFNAGEAVTRSSCYRTKGSDHFCPS